MVKKEKSKAEVEYIPVRIIRDKRQTSIRIPAKIVKALDVDSEKDLFIFEVDKKNLHLKGELVDKEKYEEDVLK